MKEEAKRRREDEKKEAQRIKEQEMEERVLKKELLQMPPSQGEEKKKPVKKRADEEAKKKDATYENPDFLPVTWAASYLPIRQIKNGIIVTSDNRYVKLIEILPINFLLRSPAEQRNIIFSYMSYLKIAPQKFQIKVISKKAEIDEYIQKIREEAEQETDPRCKMLQEDYIRLIKTLGTKEAITRRFFLVFEYQSYNGKKNPEERDVLLYMKSAVQTAKKYLALCGNVVLEHENDTRFLVETFYQILNRKTSMEEPLDTRIRKVRDHYLAENGRESLKKIPVTELIAPETIELRSWNYVVIDGVYHTYLFIPSQKYRTRVPAGWLSLLINAGEGIDVDVFFFRQDKAKSLERIGRRIRLNRSKIKDACLLWYLEEEGAAVAKTAEGWIGGSIGEILQKRIYYACIREEMTDMEQAAFRRKTAA